MYLHIFILMCLDTLIIAMQTPTKDTKFKFNTLSNEFLPYAYTPDPLFGVDKGATEQLSFDPSSKLIYAVVGTFPDMVLTTPDCKTLIVAIEAEPYDDNANAVLVDNPGGIGLVKFPQGPNGAYTKNVLGFHSFDDRYFAELESQGVMYINRNATFSDDVEPEYITLNTEGTLAYVSLQENNGIAVVDLASEEIVDIFGLGFKDWSLANIDPSDRDGGVHMQPWKVFGMYQPDAIKMLRFQNEDFIVTANEGDSKDYDYFSEENRVGDFVLSELFERNATLRDEWTTDSVLGRLKVTSVKGKNETTQHYDQLYSFGGRGFSIRRASDMSLVYDSGDEIATKTAELLPHLFNANFDESTAVSDSSDTRSDDKGPETESIAIGHIGDITLLFIGNERGSTIAVYTLDQTAAEITPQFETFIYGVGDSDETWGDLYTARDMSMVDPEDITFIAANDSPNGKPLLLVGGGFSGTVTVLQMDVQLGLPNTASALSRIFKSSLSITEAWITCYLFHVLLY
ncbi:mesenchyme-specific cell surface glycoprotein-like isoform X2 [Mya arenaria]|uniref:mesenchyme-specific cell surface glycoprotein-like isoform X2 n=1 Tax=Mya arenaria TaxID=6604 RepID=UPI0022E51CD2|nr:mesenchyme-specific cell surface glycoprotein-like isoform X2 [Mya arenaria]